MSVRVPTNSPTVSPGFNHDCKFWFLSQNPVIAGHRNTNYIWSHSRSRDTRVRGHKGRRQRLGRRDPPALRCTPRHGRATAALVTPQWFLKFNPPRTDFLPCGTPFWLSRTPLLSLWSRLLRFPRRRYRQFRKQTASKWSLNIRRNDLRDPRARQEAAQV